MATVAVGAMGVAVGQFFFGGVGSHGDRDLQGQGRIERRVGSGTFLKIATNGRARPKKVGRSGNAIGSLIQSGYSESAVRYLERLQQSAEASGNPVYACTF